MCSGDNMIVTEDLDNLCNRVSYISSLEGNNSDSGSLISDKINSLMQSGDKIIFPGDLEDFCYIFS